MAAGKHQLLMLAAVLIAPDMVTVIFNQRQYLEHGSKSVSVLTRLR